jgi:hypothetical protein
MRPKPPATKPAARAKSRGAKTKSGSRASGREEFGELIDLIADAKERGVFDPNEVLRVVARSPRSKRTTCRVGRR